MCVEAHGESGFDAIETHLNEVVTSFGSEDIDVVRVLREIDFTLLDLIEESVLTVEEALEFAHTVVLLASVEHAFDSEGEHVFQALVNLRGFNDDFVHFHELAQHFLDLDFLLLFFQVQVACEETLLEFFRFDVTALTDFFNLVCRNLLLEQILD